MRIGIDMIAGQSPGTRRRGIGRYVHSLVATLLAQDQANHYFLYHYDGLPREEPPSGPRVTSRSLPVPTRGGERFLGESVDALVRTNPDRLDLFLVTSPFEGLYHSYRPPAKPLNGLKMGVVLYDFIPFLFQEQYLTQPLAGLYYNILHTLGGYDLFLAISEATRADSATFLRGSERRVVNISSASDPSFFVPPAQAFGPGAEQDLLAGLGITRPYVFNVGGMDDRKNWQGLIEAFGLLPASLRASHQLVLTFSMKDEDVEEVRALARRHGVSEPTVLTRAVPDTTLRTLYQRCAVFAFPSFYEGFGLPILEAMHCGAPVVAGRNSSQIEVVGDAGLLVRAADSSDISEKIRRVLEGPKLAAELRRRGLHQARHFRWETTADRALRAFAGQYHGAGFRSASLEAPRPRARGRGVGVRESAPASFGPLTLTPAPSPPSTGARGEEQPASAQCRTADDLLVDEVRPSETMTVSSKPPEPAPEARKDLRSFGTARSYRSKPRLAFFSPLPPNHSGIADYALHLLEELKTRYAIDIYHDSSYVPHLAFSGLDFGCFDCRTFDRRASLLSYRGILYQMGNSPYHASIYETLLRHPGIVTLHDFTLTDFHCWYDRQPETPAGHLQREIDYCSPERAAEVKASTEQWWREPGGLPEKCTRERIYLNRRVFENSLAVVVHDPGYLQQLRELCPQYLDRTRVIPLGMPCRAVSAEERQAIRARLDLPRDALIFGAFGLITARKMAVETVTAFAPVAKSCPEALLLFVGQEKDEGATRAQARALGLESRVRILGRQLGADFDALVQITDVGLNLRRPPTSGETSASLLNLLGAGIPSIAIDVGTFSSYPAEVLCKVPCSDRVVERLTDVMLQLARDPRRREQLGANALEHVRRHHSWGRAAALYVEAIETCHRQAIGAAAG